MKSSFMIGYLFQVTIAESLISYKAVARKKSIGPTLMETGKSNMPPRFVYPKSTSTNTTKKLFSIPFETALMHVFFQEKKKNLL